MKPGRSLPTWHRLVVVHAAAVLVVAGPSGAPAAGPTRDPGDVLVQRSVYLMGTAATLTVQAADRARGLQVLEDLLESLEVTEARLSTWRADSLLSAVNREPVGRSYVAEEALCALLLRLRRWHRETDGAFDPAIGSLIDVWGLRSGGRRPTPTEIRSARDRAGLEHLAIETSPCRITRRRPVTLDAGAFGKGAALARATRVAASLERTAWMIDLGGQVAVGGSKARGWDVALAHPRRRDDPFLSVRLASGSLATSGGSVRDLELADHRIGHILDPRTGRTISRDGSVSVWDTDALVADVLSTALYVMGYDAGLDWAERHHVAAAFLIPRPGVATVTVRATSAFRARFPQVVGLPPSTSPDSSATAAFP